MPAVGESEAMPYSCDGATGRSCSGWQLNFSVVAPCAFARAVGFLHHPGFATATMPAVIRMDLMVHASGKFLYVSDNVALP